MVFANIVPKADNKNSIRAALVTVCLLLISCDGSNDIAIQKVDSTDRLTDKQLRQQQKQALKQPGSFYFGFDLRASPQEDAAQYLPFLTYLESATGYRFKLYFTPKNSSTVEELGADKIQFAAMGATGFLKAESQYEVLSLVRGVNLLGKTEYQSVFVVRPNSGIESIKDIKGKRMAFGSRDSTQGHLIPRIILDKNNIKLEELKSYTYTGSHQNCAEAVVSGKSDVCGMQDQLALKLAAQGLVKIIHTSENYPSSGIVVRKSIPVEVIQRVKQALEDFEPKGKHQAGLYNWDKTEMPNGFVAAMPSDYTNLRRWAIKLGFLPGNVKQEKQQ